MNTLLRETLELVETAAMFTLPPIMLSFIGLFAMRYLIPA